ncbi:MAG: hypothetical protein AAFR96_11360 [Planctomycetota bacterium]
MSDDGTHAGVRLLWDLIPGWSRRPQRAEPAAEPTGVDVPNQPDAPQPVRDRASRVPRAELYPLMTRAMLSRYKIRVRKWRSSSSGVAWEVRYTDGSLSRLIESPRPRGPMSAAIFLHEVGHHAIGFHTYTPRCLEEYHAWMYSLQQMEAWEISITDRVRERVHDSLHYAVCKARRRGLKKLPAELAPYAVPRRRN